jgi:hypothetical protein
MSPTSISSTGNRHGQNMNNGGMGQDVAMRVRKYRYAQYQHQGGAVNTQGTHNSTRGKTQSQRGLSELMRNQAGGGVRQKINGYNQNKVTRVQSNANATIENRG